MPGIDLCTRTRPRRRCRQVLALAAGTAALVGVGALPGAATPQTAGEVGWHQTPFAGEGHSAWLDRTGDGSVLMRSHSPVSGSSGPWVERALVPDGTVAPEEPLDPAIVPERAAVLGGGPRVILATPAGVVARSGDVWSGLGDPALPGLLQAARSNERGEVLVGDGRRFAIRTGECWIRSFSPGESGSVAMGLGEDGSALVAWTASRRGTVLPRIESLRHVPGSGWRRLPTMETGAPSNPGGVAIDGSGIATLVYSNRAEGVRAVTIAPGDSGWRRPVRVGPGEISAVGGDLAGNVWALTLPDPDRTPLAVMTRSPGGQWRRSAAFDGIAPSLLVTPLGDVVVSMIGTDSDGSWRLARRDAVTRRWASAPNRYAGSSAATNRAGDIVAAHIHPIEQGNVPRAFIDRFVAPPRADVTAVRAPGRIRRGASATVRATVSRAGPVLVTVDAGARRQIAASAVAPRAGTVTVTLPGRLTRLLPAGRARLTVDTGGHDRTRAVRSVRVALVGRPT